MELPSIQSPVWSEQISIQSYDVDATRRATIVPLCRYFLDAAWRHAEQLDAGFEQLRAIGKFWALARLTWEGERYPIWGEQVILRTWPRGTKMAFALRDFEFNDKTGKRLAAGSTEWLVVDAATKRPQRLHKLFPKLFLTQARSALGRDPERLEDNNEWEKVSVAPVRYSDIDVNAHVNSSRYIAFMVDAYPIGFHRLHSLRRMDVNYLSETREGEQLTVRTRHIDGLSYMHSLINETGKEVCRSRLEWTLNQDAATV